MKKLLLFTALAFSSLLTNAQCTPDPTITDPGIYPDTIVNLPHAYAGAAYSTVIQINTLTDTTVAQGNVVVDDIELDNVTGLPAGFSYVCNPANCVFPAGQTKCMVVNGTPPYSPPGVYELIINVTLHGRLFGFIPVSQPSQMLGYKIVILGPPVANFSGTPTTICSQSTVTYSDLSTNEPTSWLWSFPGGTPSSSTLQIPPAIKYTSGGTKNVTLTVTSPAGNNSHTKTAYITVNSLPTATVTPTGAVTICSGSNILLTANSGIGLTYLWKKNGVDIAGATNISYTATTGGTYKVRVTKTSTGCSKASPETVVSISTVTATVTPQGPTTFCSGGSVLLTANPGAGLGYQWKKNGVNISGATLQNYNATSGGTYKIQVTNSNGCSKTSTGVAVVVNPLPSATVTANGPLSFCAGGSVTFTAASGAGYTYLWKKNGVIISGATNQLYTAFTAGTYRAVVTSSITGCSKTSTAQVVTIPCKQEGSAITEESVAIIYPNPSSLITNVDVEIPQPGTISIRLFNITGKLIENITEGTFQRGKHSFSFNVQSLDKGIYFVVINTSDKSKTYKLAVNRE